MFILFTIALVVVGVAALAGFHMGYALGEKHGRESADAERAAEVLDVNTSIVIDASQSRAEVGRAVASALVAELERTRLGTLGPHATRAEALEHVR